MDTNPFEARARATKVVAITDWIWAHLTPAERTSTRLPDAVAGWTNEGWQTAAEAAGVLVPSPTSRTEVIARLRRLVSGERRARRTA